MHKSDWTIRSKKGHGEIADTRALANSLGLFDYWGCPWGRGDDVAALVERLRREDAHRLLHLAEAPFCNRHKADQLLALIEVRFRG